MRRRLDEIPDDATFEDIQYHIYVREKIERGLKDVDEGRVVSAEEMDRPLVNQAARRKPAREQNWTGPEWACSRSSSASSRLDPAHFSSF